MTSGKKLPGLRNSEGFVGSLGSKDALDSYRNYCKARGDNSRLTDQLAALEVQRSQAEEAKSRLEAENWDLRVRLGDTKRASDKFEVELSYAKQDCQNQKDKIIKVKEKLGKAAAGNLDLLVGQSKLQEEVKKSSEIGIQKDQSHTLLISQFDHERRSLKGEIRALKEKLDSELERIIKLEKINSQLGESLGSQRSDTENLKHQISKEELFNKQLLETIKGLQKTILETQALAQRREADSYEPESESGGIDERRPQVGPKKPKGITPKMSLLQPQPIESNSREFLNEQALMKISGLEGCVQEFVGLINRVFLGFTNQY